MRRVLALTAVALAISGLGYGYHRGAPVRDAAHRLSLCKNTDWKCMTPILGDLAISDGTGAAFSLLKQIYPTLTESNNRCFDLAQHIGVYVAQNQNDYSQLRFEPQSVYCNFGFYQGYAREYLLTTRDTERAQALCALIAEQMRPYSTGAADECFRGVGHALPFIAQHVQGDVSAMALHAISMCEKLAPDGSNRDTCLSGLFSNLGTAQRSSLNGLHPPKTNDPMQLCRQIPTQYMQPCEQNFKRTFVDGKSGIQDLPTVLETSKIKYPRLTREDLVSVSYTTGYDNMYAANPMPAYEAVVGHCASYDIGLQRECIAGMGVGLAKNGTPGEQDTQFKPFCDSVRAEYGESAPECPEDRALIYLKGFFTKKKFRAMCDQFGLKTGACVLD